MKKLLSVFLLFALCLCAVSCDGSTVSREARGEELTSLVDEMVKSDSFIKMYFNGINVYDELIADIRKADYRVADAIYRLDFSENEAFEKLVNQSLELDGMSERLKKRIVGSLGSVIAAELNSSATSHAVALSSVFTASINFVDKSVAENEYYIYTFDGGYPMFIVFTPHEDGAVTASARFILNPKFKCSNADEINESFRAFRLLEITSTKIK